MPTYNRIEIPLPAPPENPPLPPSIFFDIDTCFSTQETTRIRNLILLNISTWNRHFVQKQNSPYLSQLAECCQKYAINGLTPLWSRKLRITSETEGANLAMNMLTLRFIENGTGEVEAAKIRYRLPNPEEQFHIIRKTTIRKHEVSLNVTINPQVIDNLTISNLTLIGSLLHAWLHRVGFDHPESVYTSYLIGELPMCVMRGYQDKNPTNVPDSLLTQFFD
jgi:hypothetical protein